MAVPFDPIGTIIKQQIVPGVVDGVFRNSPFLASLRKQGVEPMQGPSFQENFMYDALVGGPYKKGATRDITRKQIATGATVTPRYYSVAVPALLEDLNVEMNHPDAVFKYLDLLMQAAALTMSGLLSNAAYRHGQNLSGSDRSAHINGLDEALSDGSTNGFDGRTYPTYLGVTRTDVNSALTSPMTGPAASVSGAISFPILEQAYQSVVIGSEQPNMVLTSNLGLAYLKMAFQAQQRFEKGDLDFGFEGVRFNAATVVPDNYCPGTRTATSVDTDLGYAAVAAGETYWFLNTKFLRMYLATDPLFAFGFTGFIPVQDNPSSIVGHYQAGLNITNQAPRLMRQLYAVTG